MTCVDVLTVEQRSHVEGLIDRFGRALREKYTKGQQEHGGNVWMKPGMLKEAKAEVLDQWVYLDAIEQQVRERDPALARFLMGESCGTCSQGDGCGE